MPATEKTWYDQRLLHTVFGCTGLVLLISTFWMFMQDHEREWKKYQRQMRGVEQKLLGYRLRAAEEAQRVSVADREQELLAATAELPPQELIDQFKAASQGIVDISDDSRLEATYQELTAQENGNSGLRSTVASASRKVEQAQQAIAAAEEPEAKVAAASQLSSAEAELVTAKGALNAALAEAAALRSRMLARLNRVLKRAQFEMDEAVGIRKLAAAEFAKVTADQGLLVRDGMTDAAEQKQVDVDATKEALDTTTLQQESTTARRNRLKEILSKITADEDRALKQLDEARAEATRLNTAIDESKVSFFSSKTLLGKAVLETPILDAFNSPLKIDNLWTENLTEPNGSFGQVRRFDRCTTCHRGIDKTAPGSAVLPAYEQRHEVVLRMQAPVSEPEPGQTLEDVFGIVLAADGLIDKDEVTVEFVAGQSPAAQAVNTSDSACAGGLMEGDVIRVIDGDRVDTRVDAIQFLLADTDHWGSSIELVVERGLPQPYSSHPRLDLYVGSLSPHRMAVVGCTVCHEGQGSGTSFNYASHTPNSLEQEDEWRKEYGWFNNHHWIYPMMPARFAESACLKCHHEVLELGPSERFPETPAPKLLAGHNLVKAYGCFGCHEINGYKSAKERVGPDLRLEPNYFAAAAQLSHDRSFQQLPVEDQALAHHVVQHPEDDGVRHQLLSRIAADQRSEEPQLSAAAVKVSEVLNDIETPGTLRKAGPSLRHIGNKAGPEFLYDWIRQPAHFRPSTKMPQIFGMWDHLEGDSESLQKSQIYEPVEILGLVTYLLDRTQPMEHVNAAEDCEPADAERGRLAFELRGCLACHQHSGLDDSTAGTILAQQRLGVSRQMQGPDLSNLGDKFQLADTPDATQWLYTWLRNPQLYHPRTKMPNVYLEPTIDAVSGKQVDPAADIAAFLLSSSNDWEPGDDVKQLLTPDPTPVPWKQDEDSQEEESFTALESLALEYLKKAFFTEEALQYVKGGIPADRAVTLKGNEVELLNVDDSPGDMQKKLLLYVGSKTVTKFGCYGCHDVPGFEDAKPIGTALTDWGRKDPSKIAFEHIAEYIDHGHGHGHGHAADGHSDVAAEDAIDESFYTHRLEHHDRTGFIWQKLKEPRSYDYEKARNKDYNERLRMPMFGLTPKQREEVMTFVLGLVAEPPANEFVYHPDERQEAIIAGTSVLDKYNCAGCHILEPEKWEMEYQPGEFEAPFAATDVYPFMRAHLPTDVMQASKTPDKQRGTLSAELEGMPQLLESSATPLIIVYDDFEEDWLPIEPGDEYDPAYAKYSVSLWKPEAVDGNAMDVGQNLAVADANVKRRHLAYGGDLTLRLLPRVLEVEKRTNSAAKGTETWGWLPPPLHDEGSKVQPDWLHSFLLDPQPIRPAAYMRMPKFNMSPAEATALVNYFAAKDDATYPYEYLPETSPERLAGLQEAYEGERFDDAMQIVTYTKSASCVSCHTVADWDPGGTPRAKAPNLADVYKRLRSDYVRRWVANPKNILPYTPMLSIIKFDESAEHLGGMPQELYHGSSIQQLDAVVDLLMNFDKYTVGRSEIAPMVQTAPAGTAGAPLPDDQASVTTSN